MNIPMTFPTAVPNSQSYIEFNTERFVGPITIDFTADIVMRPIGANPAVSYSKKHFHFEIPYGSMPTIPDSTIQAIVNGTYS